VNAIAPMQLSTRIARAGYTARPLLSVCAAVWMLDIDEDKVLALVETGDLLWGFNVGSSKAMNRLVRILTHSLESYVAARAGASVASDPGWETVADMIFPQGETMTGPQLGRSLNCGRSHVINLIREGHFELARPGWRRGPSGSPVIKTESARRWLLGRRIV